MAANSSNPFLDSVNAWGERSMAFLNSMLREPAASPFLSPSMTGFMPPGMNFPGMPSATPHWNPFGNLNSPPTSAGMDWMGQAQQFYQMLQQAMGSLPDVRQIDVAGVADMWRKAMSDAMATPGLPTAFTQQWQQALDTPGLGFAREHQGRLQEWLKARDAYLVVMQRYGQKMQTIQTEGMRRFEQRLQVHSAPDKQLKSMRAVFDVWVDASEEAFAEAALADDYRHLYGELVNSQMRLRSAGQAITDSVSAAMGLPTRSELDGAHRKTHALKQELREMKRRIHALEQRRAQAPVERAGAEQVPTPSGFETLATATAPKKVAALKVPAPSGPRKKPSKTKKPIAAAPARSKSSSKARMKMTPSAKVVSIKQANPRRQPLIALAPPPAAGKSPMLAAGKSAKRKGG